MMATADSPKLAEAVTRADEASIAETTPAPSLAPFAAVVPQLPHRRRRRQAVLRRRHPDRRQLCFRQAAQAAHGLGGERSPSNRCRCSRPQRRSNDGQHRCGASRCPHRLPRRPGKAGRGSGRGRELDAAAERCCYAQEQESAEVGARSEPSPRPVPVWRSVLARGPDRRLGSARLRAKGARLPAGRIRSRRLHAQFLVR
jgi:hypothetical protein